MKNKNLFKKLMGTFLMSTMAFSSTGVLSAFAGNLKIQKTFEIDLNKICQETDGLYRLFKINICREKAEKIKAQLDINDIEDIAKANLNDIEELKNIMEISPHAILEHTGGCKNNFDEPLSKILNSGEIKIVSEGVSYNEAYSSEEDKKASNYKYSLQPQEGFEKRREIKISYKIGDETKYALMITANIKNESGALTEKERIISFYPCEKDTPLGFEKINKCFKILHTIENLRAEFYDKDYSNYYSKFNKNLEGAGKRLKRQFFKACKEDLETVLKRGILTSNHMTEILNFWKKSFEEVNIDFKKPRSKVLKLVGVDALRDALREAIAVEKSKNNK